MNELRQDYEYYIPVTTAQMRSNRKRKRSILTGAIITAFALRYWIVGIFLFTLLAIVNLVQKGR